MKCLLQTLADSLSAPPLDAGAVVHRAFCLRKLFTDNALGRESKARLDPLVGGAGARNIEGNEPGTLPVSHFVAN
jgi:hypothetical protein